MTSRTGTASSHSTQGRGPRWFASFPTGARVATVAALVPVVVLGVAVGADAALTTGRIHPGVRVGGVAVGGMTVSEASAAIGEGVAAVALEPVAVTVADERWQVTAEEVGFSVDATALAEEAFAVGRGNALAVVSGRIDALLGGYEVPLAGVYDPALMKAFVASINDVVATPAVNAGVVVEGTTLTRTDPATGMGIDVATAGPLIADAFLSETRLVNLTIDTLQPAIDTPGAQAAYDTALAMVSGPVTLFYGEKEWVVPPETIGGWIGFRPSAADGSVLEAYIVSQDVSATVVPMVAEVGRPAKDATFSATAGSVTIVPAEDGLAADAEDLAKRLTTILATPGDRRAELTLHTVAASRTTEDAMAMGITDRLSTFTTDYDASNKPRVNNIHILADALNGTLIAPGETFSFNGTIGERTAAKGYKEANAIVNGKLVPQLGGGICQVGTTIFNTVFFSGLPVVERHNHSQYISHYPKGRDATVSWGGPDFKFTNDTPNWILIATSYTRSSVTIALYGTPTGYEVTYTTGAWTNIVPPKVREVSDPKLPVGSRVVDERGVSGRTIVVTRTVTKGGQVLHTDTFKSVYRPTEEVIRVGTKPDSSTPATSSP